MPCLILTGHPCSGKSSLARVIRKVALQQFSDRIQSVVIVRDPCCDDDHDDRDNDNTDPVDDDKSLSSAAACYQDAATEKRSRAQLKSALDRILIGKHHHDSNKKNYKHHHHRHCLVIVDSANSLKGVRYELYCLCKAAHESYGVVWVLNRLDVIRTWNHRHHHHHHRKESESENERIEEESQGANHDHGCSGDYHYAPALLDDLIRRYEPPDARNRWDAPLYIVDMSLSAAIAATSMSPLSPEMDVWKHSVYDMHQTRSTDRPVVAVSTTTGTMKEEDDASTRTTQKRAQFKRPTPAAAAAAATTTTPTPTPTIIPASTNAITTATAIEPLPAAESLSFIGDVVTTTLETRVETFLRSFLDDHYHAPLTAGASTLRHDAADSDLLHHMDRLTRHICHALTSLSSHTSALSVSSSSSTRMIWNGKQYPLSLIDNSTNTTTTVTSGSRVQRSWSAAELRQQQRLYMSWITAHPPSTKSKSSSSRRCRNSSIRENEHENENEDNDEDEDAVQIQSFLAYLETHAARSHDP